MNNRQRITLISFLAYFVLSGMLAPIGIISGPLAELYGRPVAEITTQFSWLTGELFLSAKGRLNQHLSVYRPRRCGHRDAESGVGSPGDGTRNQQDDNAERSRALVHARLAVRECAVSVLAGAVLDGVLASE